MRSWGIRQYVVFFILLILGGLILYTVLSTRFLHASFLKVEKKHAMNLSEGIERYFCSLLEDILGKTRDEAVWDEAYVFLRERSPEFVRANICPSAFRDNDIDVFLFLDLRGKPVAGGRFEPLSGQILLDDKVKRLLYILRSALSPDIPLKKIMWFEDLPLAVAAHAVLKSDGSGPPCGYVIMGRFIKREDLEKIAEMFRVERIGIISDNSTKPMVTLSDGRLHFVKPNFLGNTRMSLEIFYRPALDLYDLTKKVLFIQLLLVAGILGLLFVLVTKTLTRPLSSLLQAVRDLPKGMPISRRFGLKEIDSLSSTLFDTLGQITEINQKLRLLNRALADIATSSTREEVEEHTRKALEAILGKDFSGFTGDLMKRDILNQLQCGPAEREMVEVLFRASFSALEQLKLREKLHEMAMKDPLTGLYNRAFLAAYLPKEIEKAKRKGLPLSLMVMDLDDLKPVNDTLGHEAGDELLRRGAKVLEKVLRKSDIAVRYGGDEFLVVLPETDLRGAITVRDRLKREIQRHNAVYRDKPPLLMSIGVATWDPQSEKSFQQVFAEADADMYREKSKKKPKNSAH